MIAEDDVLLRTGLSRLLQDDGIDVEAEVGDAESLLAAVDEHAPDVVVTDIRMPPTHRDEGTRAALTLRGTHPALGVVLLSQHVEPRYAERLLRDHRRGIGYLLKDRISTPAEFVGAVRRVAGGESVIDPQVVSALLSRAAAERDLATLSAREREVLALVASGRSNAAVAQEAGLQQRTVESHIASLFGKLGLVDDADSNRRVLAVLAHLRAAGSGP